MLGPALRRAAQQLGKRAAAASPCTLGACGMASAVGRAQAGSASAWLCGTHGTAVAGALLAASAVVGCAAPVFAASGPAGERSFIMIKPDGVNRGLAFTILHRMEAKGYKLVGIKVLVPSKDLARHHYQEHEGKPFFEGLVAFLTSGAVVATVWEGKEVVKYARTMIGATSPLASAPGTIRGDYAVEVGRNIIHGSDSTDSAQREIALWFDPKELADYVLMTRAAIYEK